MKEAGVTPRKFMFGVMPGKRFIMAQQIVSLKHKTGTYEGNAYDNYMRSLYFRLKLWDCLHLWIKKEKRSYAIICATDNLKVNFQKNEER